MEIVANSVAEAIQILESRATAIDGRESYFQAHDTDEKRVYQIFYDDEDGDDTIIWTGRKSAYRNPAGNTIIQFDC